MHFSLSAIVLVAVSATAVLGQGETTSTGAKAGGDSQLGAIKTTTDQLQRKIQAAGIQEKLNGAPVKLQGAAGIIDGGKADKDPATDPQADAGATSTKQKRNEKDHDEPEEEDEDEDEDSDRKEERADRKEEDP
ncbi:hypothetical protein BDA99DRAFT_573999 [Phascolomyces articulosus]|uniref:Uncharacterized protein n=1 Tax=Phascolomyces articulosus TaxID=60185 RepID=A0AAD5JVL0_9FUNG|nr:hypothetical protein BDA99DRAFT_573999 [Phascolomyces articulosus]